MPMIICWAMVDSPVLTVSLSRYLSYPRGVHNIGLWVKTSSGLRALMKSALPPLITTAASRALDLIRVEGSRSDLSCHQLAATWHRAAGLLHGLLPYHSHQKFWPLFFCDLAVLHPD